MNYFCEMTDRIKSQTTDTLLGEFEIKKKLQ